MLFLGLCLGARGVAGTTGVMNGYVREENGPPVAGVRVTAISPSNVATAYTDGRGFFAFVNLAPGVYLVDFEKIGKQPSSAPGVRINSDQTTFLVFHFRFRCGGVANTSAGSDQRAQVFSSIDLRQVERYPPNAIWIPLAPVPVPRDRPPFPCL